ncbi:MAG: cell division protein FtsA [Patescibacteria group bacterium]|nr:cell division protein FtsA [Patescibacteria group bacterium]
MSSQRVITAIDIGTDKCVTLIAIQDGETEQLRIAGFAAIPSKGMKKSQIIDLEQVLLTLNESLDAAERMAGLEVKQAYISVTGGHISSQNSRGVVAVASPDQEITAEDVTRVIEAARAISLPSDREVIHVIPKDFSVDSQTGIKDPVGMTGIRLESEAHIITGLSPSLRNTEKCIHDLGIEIEGFVFSGLASSQVVLTETEKELGVVVIDIGAGSTSMSAFVDGSLEFSCSLPLGARHITQDIALGCRVSLDAAERIKTHLSLDKTAQMIPLPGEIKPDFNKRRRQADQLHLSDLNLGDDSEVYSKRSIIDGIMAPRLREIFSLVGEKLETNQLFPLVPAGLVITGGGAKTISICDVAKNTLKLPARIGQPTAIPGLLSDVQDPVFATGVGLLVFASKRLGGETHNGFSFSALTKNFSLSKLKQQVGKFFKSILP